jgi:hypothetical protein
MQRLEEQFDQPRTIIRRQGLAPLGQRGDDVRHLFTS